jgi:hypothetical protein
MKKGKNRENYVELSTLYFIWVLRAPYYQGEYIEWVGKMQNIKNLPYHQKLLSGQTYPTPSRILEPLVGHVRPLGETCPAPLPNPGSKDLTRTCPAPRPDMSDLSTFSRVN